MKKEIRLKKSNVKVELKVNHESVTIWEAKTPGKTAWRNILVSHYVNSEGVATPRMIKEMLEQADQMMLDKLAMTAAASIVTDEYY